MPVGLDTGGVVRGKSRWHYSKQHNVLKVPGTGRVWQGLLLGAVLLAVLLMLLAGKKSLFKLLALYREQEYISSRVEETREENQKLEQGIKNLQQNPGAVEDIAREELGMLRPNELIYRFVSPDQAVAEPEE